MNSKPRWIVGVDYSMSCPAITIFSTDVQDFTFDVCQIHYLSEKSVKNLLPNVHASRLSEYAHNEERFDLISDWAMSAIPTQDCVVYIEDYSLGSKGKVFHIAENAGLLKNKLWRAGIPIHPVAPTVVKKFATGRGNAKKDQMHEAFTIDTGFDLMPIFQPKAKSVGSPVGDIVDSFYICKYGYNEQS